MASRIYVGNLPIDIKESEIDDLFYKYGKITDIDLKCPARPPAFAFVSFRDVRDAEDAIRGRDNYTFDGYRLRCEFAKGDRRDGGRGDDRRDDRIRGRTGGRRTDYGVIVTNLPQGTSWQDLKDHMRKAGDVVFTDVDRHGDGVVEFSNRSDMEHAVRKLDDTELKTRNNDTSYIRVKLAKAARDRSEDGRDSRKDKKRSPSRSRSVSRSRSPARRSRSHSRSRSNSADSASRKRKSSEDDIKPLSASSADAAAVAEVIPADEEAK